MTVEKESPASGETDRGHGTADRAADHSATPRMAQPRKWQRVLRWFVDGGTLNRFQAYRELRDSCLNTTVSQLEQRGVRILRHEETVPGAFGPVHCCRYVIAPEARQRARALLGLPSTAEEPRDAHNALPQAGAAL